MKQGEYFKINSIEELRQVYNMFKGKWDGDYSLEDEIYLFYNYDCRYIKYGIFGIFLAGNRNIPDSYNRINNPIKNINNLNKLI